MGAFCVAYKLSYVFCQLRVSSGRKTNSVAGWKLSLSAKIWKKNTYPYSMWQIAHDFRKSCVFDALCFLSSPNVHGQWPHWKMPIFILHFYFFIYVYSYSYTKSSPIARAARYCRSEWLLDTRLVHTSPSAICIVLTITMYHLILTDLITCLYDLRLKAFRIILIGGFVHKISFVTGIWYTLLGSS